MNRSYNYIEHLVDRNDVTKNITINRDIAIKAPH